MKNLSRVAHVSLRLLAGVVALSVAASQTAFAAGPQTDAAPSQTVPASSTITVPAGTVIPLALVSQIKSKSTQVGDTVRAQVAFPVTADAQVAIPAGTFVEGVVTSLTASEKKTHQPEVEIHFVRLVYANGYVANLDATNTQASNHPADAVPSSTASPQFSEATLPAVVGAGGSHTAFYGGEGFASSPQVGFQPVPPLQPSQPQEPQRPGPSPALIGGLVVGIPIVLLIVGAIFGLHHKGGNSDYVLYDVGWQFQMTLATPLTVDAGQASAAAALTPQ